MTIPNGVGVIITNPDRTLFYLQKKDETYQFEHFRGWYSFFGGSLDLGETKIEALVRELKEELSQVPACTVIPTLEERGDFDVECSTNIFQFTLFESVQPDVYMRLFDHFKVHEGRGKLVRREDVSLDFVHGLGSVMQWYLGQY